MLLKSAPPKVGGLGLVCSIQLAYFCITPTGSTFLISVVQRAVDFEGLIYFVAGIGRLDKSQRRNHSAGTVETIGVRITYKDLTAATDA